MHRSEKAGEVERALTQLLSVMVSLDKAQTLHMLGLVKSTGAYAYVMDECADPAFWKLPEARQAFAALRERLDSDEMPGDVAALDEFRKHVRTAIGKLPLGAAPDAFLAKFDAEYIGLVEEHQELRNSLAMTLAFLCATMDGDVLNHDAFVAKFLKAMKE